jgi:hypothetical protein
MHDACQSGDIKLAVLWIKRREDYKRGSIDLLGCAKPTFTCKV